MKLQVLIDILVEEPTLIDEILTELDSIAQSCDNHEYGLPVFHESVEADESVKAKMRSAIIKWLMDWRG